MFRSVLAVLVAFIVVGCQASNVSEVDPDRILRMAGEEAGQIDRAADRLGRQLNIAYLQVHTGKPEAARQTLVRAREAIERADQGALTDRERLAGWVSISELGREADDKGLAGAALERAMAALDGVTPQEARCKYVPGVERELRAIRGDRAAVAFLTTAAEWAMEIPEQGTRRSAYAAYATELFRCDDYDAARAALRRDADAAWRTDALTAISGRLRYENPAAGSGWMSGGVRAFAATASPADAGGLKSGSEVGGEGFGTPLDFMSNFYRR